LVNSRRVLLKLLMRSGVVVAVLSWNVLSQPSAIADEAASTEPSISENEREHWSFRPLANPEAPEVQKKDWPRNPIDNFILARIEKADLSPAPPADRVTLIRRATL